MTGVGDVGRLARRAVPTRPASGWLRSRLREPAFWYVQAGVVGVTALHWLVESTGLADAHDGPLTSLLHVSVVLYLLPVVHAGLRYGFEGSLLTGVSIALLATPNQFLWHAQDFEWVGELVFLGLIIAIGAVIALPVEREQLERARAEMAHHRARVAGHRLELMNDVTSMLVRTADMDMALGRVLHRLAGTLHLEAAAVMAWSASEPTPTLLACHGGRDAPARLRAAVGDLAVGDLDVDLDGDDPAPDVVDADGGGYVAPFTLDEGHAGALVVRCGRPLQAGEQQLLDAIGRQVGVALDNLRLHREEQRALHAHLRGVTRAQEEERRRIARDLHDVATHELLLVRRDLEGPSTAVGTGDPTARADLDRAHRRLGTVIGTLRQFSRDLRPSVLDPLGLAPALEWLASQANDRQPVAVGIHVDGTPRRLDPEAELALYRIVEEALRNALQHADPSRVDVEATFTADRVTLCVCDDGRGLPTTSPPGYAADGGLGIPGMHERAALVGARLTLSPGPTGGTRVRVELVRR